MEPIYIPIVVAMIGGPVMWFLSRFDKRNTDQHNLNMKILNTLDIKSEQMNWKIDKIDDKLDKIDEKVDNIDSRVNSLESTKPRSKRSV
jgi:peptidoglycan hydrolase CwlO-like protein